MMKKFGFVSLIILSTPAFAHQGDHTGFDIAGLLVHVFETDHIVFAAIAVLTGVLAYRAGRRAEARVHAAKEISRDPR